MRFEQVDWDDETLHAPAEPEGRSRCGVHAPAIEDAAPDSPSTQGRQREGSARGRWCWCFPGTNLKDEVGPIADLRHATKDDVRSARGSSPDTTHLGVILNDESISERDQHVLSNHSFRAHNVHATYISQHMGHLAK
jgi:hypothetical protein